MEPAVDTLTTGGHDIGELGRAVFEHHALFQALDHFLCDLTHDAHGIFAVHLIGRVHQAVGQLTISGKQQQATGVDIQATDVDPAAVLEARQAVKNGGATFRVIAGTDFALGLVVQHDAAGDFGAQIAANRTVVHADLIHAVDPAAKLGGLSVDADAAGGNPAFNLAARAQPHAGQHLLQFFAWRRRGGVVVYVDIVSHWSTSRCDAEKSRAGYHRPQASARSAALPFIGIINGGLIVGG